MATEKPARIVPIYLLVDTSASMAGEPIQQVMNGMDVIREELIKDPRWDSFCVSVITFATTAQQELPLTALGDFVPPVLKADGNTSLGQALEVLMECIRREVRPRDLSRSIRCDYRPVVVLLLGSSPNDDWHKALTDLRGFRPRPCCFIACVAGLQVNRSVLQQITEDVLEIFGKSSDDWGSDLGAVFRKRVIPTDITVGGVTPCSW